MDAATYTTEQEMACGIACAVGRRGMMACGIGGRGAEHAREKADARYMQSRIQRTMHGTQHSHRDKAKQANLRENAECCMSNGCTRALTGTHPASKR